MSNRCSCGKKKYPDAECCSSCWNKNIGYDERSSQDPNRCQCGKGKISDASMCSDCYDQQSGYGD